MITYPNAVDENGQVHNISTITQENRAYHKYFCLGCNGKMVPVLSEQREQHFRHEEKGECNPETYLHNLAKKYLASKFESSQKFEVRYYAYNRCPKKDDCPLYRHFHWTECSGKTVNTLDLKKEYDTFQIEGVYKGFRADVLLTDSKDQDISPLFLEVSVSHDCTKEKLDSGIQIIEIKVKNEEDFKRPIEENTGINVPRKESSKLSGYSLASQPISAFIKFHNFCRENYFDNLKTLTTFTLFTDGHMEIHEDSVTCGEMNTKHLEDARFEVKVFCRDGNRLFKPKYDVFNLGIALALRKGLPAKHCNYCSKYSSCYINVDVLRYDNRTMEQVTVKQPVPNRCINEKIINKFQLASNCGQWCVNVVMCEEVIRCYPKERVYVWELPIEDDDIILDNLYP